ncbi:hypothetical protein SDC9_71877 [bioreactor metagenome]|uniref:Uncharacterized protein n=1 Tax=bioreactor metagenome TaxID=1076179 RepID=A0A644Y9Y9_9ZZZZ
MGKKRLVRAFLDDLALLEHHDPVGIGDGREPVRDGDDGAALAHRVQAVLDVALGLGVERRGRLVEQQDRRVLQQRAGDADALLLAARELQPALAHRRLVALGQAHHEVMDFRGSGGRDDLGLGGAGAAIGDVVADRIVEQHGVLRHHADRVVQALLGDVAEVLPVDPDRAAGDVVEAEEKPPDRRLARARGADQCHALPRRHGQRDPLQDRPVRVIGEFHRVETDLAAGDLQRRRAGLVLDLGGLVQQVEHLAHVDKCLTDLAIDRAEEAERHGDLDHVGLHHDKIAHRELARFHLERGHHHHRDKSRGDDQRLAEVQEGKALPGLHRGLLITCHRGVVPFGLAGLGAEILHRLEVQQAVDRLLVRRGVGVVHLAPDRHAPFGHLEGEGDIGPDRDHHHRGIAPVEEHREEDGDEGQLEDQRPDREQHEAQQELDALHAALDDPAQPAGLAGDVVAHRQRVDVAEGLERERAQRALRHPHEDRITQLAKAHRAKPRQPVDHRQRHRAQGQQQPLVTCRAREAVDRGLVDERRRDRDHLGHDEKHHRDQHALLHPGVIGRPQIGQHRAQRAHVARPVLGAELAGLGDLGGRHEILAGAAAAPSVGSGHRKERAGHPCPPVSGPYLSRAAPVSSPFCLTPAG